MLTVDVNRRKWLIYANYFAYAEACVMKGVKPTNLDILKNDKLSP